MDRRRSPSKRVRDNSNTNSNSNTNTNNSNNNHEVLSPNPYSCHYDRVRVCRILYQ